MWNIFNFFAGSKNNLDRMRIARGKVFKFSLALTCCLMILLLVSSRIHPLSEISARFGNSNPNGYVTKLRFFCWETVQEGHVFDVRKMCRKICSRCNRTCFDPELTVFVYRDVRPSDMFFQQTFHKWSTRDERFLRRRNFCPINEIDPSFETLTKQKKCAIVGNSGILLNSKCGQEINSHDYVIRANMAETDGYSEDVGNKTTLMMINVEMTTKIYNDLIFPDNGTVYDAILKNLRTLNDGIIWYSKAVPAGSPYSKQLQHIAEYLKRKNFKTRFAFSYKSAGSLAVKRWRTKKYPSSGLIMLMVAETLCEGISLYGFYPYEKNAMGEQILHHYYDSRLLNFGTPVHDFDEEHKLLKSLHDKGKIRLVLDPCETQG